MDLRLARFKNLLNFVHFINENVHSKVFRPFHQSVGRCCQRQSLLRLRRRRRRRQYVFAQKMRKLLFFLFLVQSFASMLFNFGWRVGRLVPRLFVESNLADLATYRPWSWLHQRTTLSAKCLSTK